MAVLRVFILADVFVCALLCTLTNGKQGSYQMYKEGRNQDEIPFYENDPFLGDGLDSFLIDQPHIVWAHGDIRLVTGTDSEIASGAGRLEVYMTSQYTGSGGDVENDGFWGTVCGEGFTLTDANVACRQLGFHSASSWDFTVNTPYGTANESVPIVLERVNCPASYLWHLMRCNVLLGDSDDDCNHQQDVAVVCEPERIWSEPYHGQVRLNGLSNSTIQSYGRVEVFQNGQWGTVCNEEFDEAGADSVCRQLGYTGAVYVGDAYPGSGIISVKDITCDSSTACFTNCFKHHLSIHDCNHTQDVAVQCGFDVSTASEYPAGYSSSCSINDFPLSMLILCILLGLGIVILVGCGIIFIITFTRCCYKCCCRPKRYEELY